MKNTGIVRNFDQLGRIVVPKEIRDAWHITEDTPIEIYVEDDKIILRKYERENMCVITGKSSGSNIQLPSGRMISKEGLLILKREIESLKTMLR